MQPDLAEEPRRLLHAEALRVPTSFALCSASGPAGQDFRQRFVQMDQLDAEMRDLPGLPDFENTHVWISQNTLKSNTRNRQIASVILLNAIWVDIDIRHPPRVFIDAGLKPPHGGSGRFTVDDAYHCAELLLMDLVGAGLPTPTCIIDTGGGLCAKWLFDQPIPSSARARWTSLQRHLVERVGAIRADFLGLQWAWPVDANACDAARILRVVGSHNPRWGVTCRMLWNQGWEHDFNLLADQVLPYTAEEVRAWRTQSATWKNWDRNRAKATAAGFVRVSAEAGRVGQAHMIEDEAVRDLWTSRFELGRQHLANRGGPGVGERNSTWWPMAVALGWSCGGDEPNLLRSLAALHQDLYQSKGWTWRDALAASSSVIAKMRAGDGYKFTTAKWLAKMGISSEEASRLQPEGTAGVHNAKRAQWNQGVMGFEQLSGLDFDDWKITVRDRQAQAGRRSAEVRATTHGLDKHRRARELAESGHSTRQIATELGVNQSTIVRWLKDE